MELDVELSADGKTQNHDFLHTKVMWWLTYIASLASGAWQIKKGEFCLFS